MPVTPIVSSPNVEGNIGQCQTTTAVISCVERTNAFICQDVGYATNSCTGKVDMYQTWGFSGLSWILIIATVLFVGLGLFIKSLDS